MERKWGALTGRGGLGGMIDIHDEEVGKMTSLMLIKKLDPRAKLPTVAHAGSDLGYDVYSLDKVFISSSSVIKIRTGISVSLAGFAFKVFDRSSISMQGLMSVGGVIDEGYRGELFINMTLISHYYRAIVIEEGAKIAQIVPFRPQTHFSIIEVSELPDSDRGDKGYGSTGK